MFSYLWKGATQPSDTGSSGVPFIVWKGAIERVLVSLTPNDIESATEIDVPALTMNYDPVRRLFSLTGEYDPETDLTGESN